MSETKMDDYDFSVTDPQIPKRNRKSLPKALQLAIFQRDKWLCQSCRTPVIFSPAMKLLEAEVKGDASLKEFGHSGKLALYHAHGTREGAPLLDQLAASIDHIEPHAKGGALIETNLRTLCWKCNVRRGTLTDEEWKTRLNHRPVRGKYGEPKHWDGLSSVFVMLANRNKSLTAGETAWLKVIKDSYKLAATAK